MQNSRRAIDTRSLKLYSMSAIATPIHNCLQATLEIAYFKEKLTDYYKENKQLRGELCRAALHIDQLRQLKSASTTADSQRNDTMQDKSVQTLDNQCETNKNQKITQPQALAAATAETKTSGRSPHRSRPIISRIPVPTGEAAVRRDTDAGTLCSVCRPRRSSLLTLKSSTTDAAGSGAGDKTVHKNQFDADIYNKQNKKSYTKLCEMQHSLFRKYEEEVNAGTVKQDLINRMSLEIDELKRRCDQLTRELAEARQQSDTLEQLEAKHRTVVIDLETEKLRCARFAAELACFDAQFFDEIEDLKHDYAEAVKLNRHYETLLAAMETASGGDGRAHELSAQTDDIRRLRVSGERLQCKRNRVTFLIEPSLGLKDENEDDANSDPRSDRSADGDTTLDINTNTRLLFAYSSKAEQRTSSSVGKKIECDDDESAIQAIIDRLN